MGKTDVLQKPRADRVEQESLSDESLLYLFYDQLRWLAVKHLATENPGQTLSATALVHEVWLRLMSYSARSGFKDRNHFLATAVQAMQRIIVDNARRKKRLKRGGKALRRVDLNMDNLPDGRPGDELDAISELVERLEQEAPHLAEVVRLRYFLEFTIEECAESLGVSTETVKRRWRFARAWLSSHLGESIDLEP